MKSLYSRGFDDKVYLVNQCLCLQTETFVMSTGVDVAGGVDETTPLIQGRSGTEGGTALSMLAAFSSFSKYVLGILVTGG